MRCRGDANRRSGADAMRGRGQRRQQLGATESRTGAGRKQYADDAHRSDSNFVLRAMQHDISILGNAAEIRL
jgi:hypothetical protein